MPYKSRTDRAAYAKHYNRRRKASDPAYLVRMRELARAGASTFRAKRKAWLDEQKAKPCQDCGNTFPPCCMDFDHRVGEMKVGNVGRLVHSAVLWVVIEEIRKCDLVCSNCHRIRTYMPRDKE